MLGLKLGYCWDEYNKNICDYDNKFLGDRDNFDEDNSTICKFLWDEVDICDFTNEGFQVYFNYILENDEKTTLQLCQNIDISVEDFESYIKSDCDDEDVYEKIQDYIGDMVSGYGYTDLLYSIVCDYEDVYKDEEILISFLEKYDDIIVDLDDYNKNGKIVKFYKNKERKLKLEAI